jgi:hypothetical protein
MFTGAWLVPPPAIAATFFYIIALVVNTWIAATSPVPPNILPVLASRCTPLRRRRQRPDDRSLLKSYSYPATGEHNSRYFRGWAKPVLLAGY